MGKNAKRRRMQSVYVQSAPSVCDRCGRELVGADRHVVSAPEVLPVELIVCQSCWYQCDSLDTLLRFYAECLDRVAERSHGAARPTVNLRVSGRRVNLIS